MPTALTLELVAATTFLTGLGGGVVIGLLWRGSQVRATRQLLAEAERRRQAETEALLDGVKLAFGDISLDSFRRIADQLQAQVQAHASAERRLQGQQLQAERLEYGQRLDALLLQFERMQGLVRELEKARAGKLAELETELRRAGEQAGELAATTRGLAELLGRTRWRGQWGERLAEDVLRAAGLVEGISYRRQAALPDGRRPDFTILLPQGRVVHLDVKFPLDNWRRAVETPDEAARSRFEAAFLRDVRARIAELAARGYADPAQGSLDLVLLLIPNDQVLAAALDLAPQLVEEALDKRVVLLSPLTLLATLAIIRQATESFRIAESAGEIVALLRGFRGAWRAYRDELERLTRRLDEAQRALQQLTGERTRVLERELDRLDALGPLDAAPTAPAPRAQ
jgi:DNA recombination protein RmuC